MPDQILINEPAGSAQPRITAVREIIDNAVPLVPLLPALRPGDTSAKAPCESASVRPLGTCDGVFFYLDSTGKPVGLTAEQHTVGGIISLFAHRLGDLYRLWPKTNRRAEVIGWRYDLVVAALMAACAERGVLNPRRLAVSETAG